MESLLSQEYINVPEENIGCQTEVLDIGQPGQLSLASSGQLGWVNYV